MELKEDQLKNMIGELKNELEDLKKLLNRIKELELLGEQEIYEIKNEIKWELNMLDYEISNLLENLNVNLASVSLKCIFYKKPHNFEEERELKLPVKKRNK